MIYKDTIAVRFLPDEYVQLRDFVNRCEGETFSERFRTFCRNAVREGKQ